MTRVSKGPIHTIWCPSSTNASFILNVKRENASPCVFQRGIPLPRGRHLFHTASQIPAAVTACPKTAKDADTASAACGLAFLYSAILLFSQPATKFGLWTPEPHHFERRFATRDGTILRLEQCPGHRKGMGEGGADTSLRSITRRIPTSAHVLQPPQEPHIPTQPH